MTTEYARRRDQSGRGLVCADDLQTMPLEKSDDQPENSVVAAAQQRQQCRQVCPKTEIGTYRQEVRTAHTPNDHDLAAAMALEGLQHCTDAAEVDQCMRIARDIRLSLAYDTDDVHASPARRDSCRDLAGDAGPARENTERNGVIDP